MNSLKIDIRDQEDIIDKTINHASYTDQARLRHEFESWTVGSRYTSDMIRNLIQTLQKSTRRMSRIGDSNGGTLALLVQALTAVHEGQYNLTSTQLIC